MLPEKSFQYYAGELKLKEAGKKKKKNQKEMSKVHSDDITVI